LKMHSLSGKGVGVHNTGEVCYLRLPCLSRSFSCLKFSAEKVDSSERIYFDFKNNRFGHTQCDSVKSPIYRVLIC